MRADAPERRRLGRPVLRRGGGQGDRPPPRAGRHRVNKSTVPVGSADHRRAGHRSHRRRASSPIPSSCARAPPCATASTPTASSSARDDRAGGGQGGRSCSRRPGRRSIVTDATTSETIKYASNAFLATKLSFVNALAGLCEEVGADARDVLLGLGLRQAHRLRVPAPGPGLGRFVPAQGHPGPAAHRRGGGLRLLAAGRGHRRPTTSSCRGWWPRWRRPAAGRLDGRHDRRVGPHLQGQHRRPAGLAQPADRPPPGRRWARPSRPSTPPSTPRPTARRPARPAAVRRPLRGGAGCPGPGRAHRVGRVPLARLRPRAGRHGRALASSTPGTCSTRRPSAAWASTYAGIGRQ